MPHVHLTILISAHLECDSFIDTAFCFIVKVFSVDHVKLHLRGNSRQRKQTYDCLKELHMCIIHAVLIVVV